jgi:acetolactate synthase I/II/III large subunit
MSEIKKITGSEAVVLSLLEEGTEIMFGYPGGAIMPVYDALYSYKDKIHHVLTRHEQGAIHAAQGYARVTGRVGVCMATSGPGATNLVTGLADAMTDSTPIVAITGQVGAILLGSDAFQETDVVGISMPVTKWNIQVTKAEDIPAAIAKAFYIAKTGRPGPVLVDITKNAQFGMMEYSYTKFDFIRSYVTQPTIDENKIAEAAKIINSAKKPYVLVGQGVALGNAEEEFKTFIEKSGIPFAWTILGANALSVDHPLNVGMLGMHGNYGANIKQNECDVLVAIGMRFDDRVTGDLNRYAKQAKVIHLEIDPSEIDKNVKTTVAILGDVKETLPKLTKLVEKKSYKAWREEFTDCNKIEYDRVIKHDMYPSKPGLSMAEVIRHINEQTDGDAIMVTDVGQHQMFGSRYFKHTKKRSFVTSGGLGTMGFGLPAALGAKMGMPDKQVILLVGDGGIQMTIQEFGTIKQTEAAVKIVLMNNNFLGMVRQWQELFFDKRYSMTELVNPDFQKVAEAYDLNHKKVTDRAQLAGAVSEMLKSKKAFLLEVVIEKENNVFPMVPTGASVSEILLEAGK